MIESPCIKICQIDPNSQLCTGCHRTLDEIARWGQAADAEKRAILGRVAERRPVSAIPPAADKQT